MKQLKTIETEGTSYNIRTVAPSDLNFIKNSWLNNFYSAFVKSEVAVSKGNFKESQYNIIESILNKSNSIVLVACDQFNPDMILAYLVAEWAAPRVYIHWAYTKHGLRSYGLAKALFATLKEYLTDEALIVTHMTPYALRFTTKQGLKYEPILWDWKRHEQRFLEISKRKIHEAGVPRVNSL